MMMGTHRLDIQKKQRTMDIEETTDEFLKILKKNSGSTSLQKEAARSARTGSGTTATGMKKIDEEDEEAQEEEEEEDELKMKTRNWRKINLSFAIELEGQDGEDIKDTEQQIKGDNDNKMKHHPIMSKIANS
jgi:ClpP class serine protease